MQGDLWSVRASDYAEVQEPTFLPLYESVLARPEVAGAYALLDIGCGPGLAVQTLARKIGRVAGIDAAAPFIDVIRASSAGVMFSGVESPPLIGRGWDMAFSASARIAFFAFFVPKVWPRSFFRSVVV